MRPTTNNPSPSAPPTVQSNVQYSGPSVQMTQPFGSGIGFRPNITNNNIPHNPPLGYQNLPMGYQSPPQTNAPYPNYSQATPSPAHYQNYVQAPQNYQIHQPPQHNYPINPPVQHNVAYGQSYQNSHYPEAQRLPHNMPQMYPNLNQSVPFSYTPPSPTIQRSTSDFMRKVIVGRFQQFAL